MKIPVLLVFIFVLLMTVVGSAAPAQGWFNMCGGGDTWSDLPDE